MGLFKRLFGTKEIEGVTYLHDGMTFHRIEEAETNDIWMRLSVSRKGDNVRIEMHGLDQVNVCLASFLTKGVSYAQEKYNEYKQSPKDIEPIEETKPKIKAASVKEWQERVEARKGGKR